MTREPDPKYETLLQELLLGERNLDSPEVQEMLSSSESCRDLYAELRELQGDLEASGSETRSEIDQAVRDTVPADRDRVAQVFHQQSSAQTRTASTPPRRSGGHLPWALAAGFLVLAGFWFVGRDDAPSQAFLGSGSIEGLAPVGEVSDYETFRWRGETLASGYYELRIRDLQDRSRTAKSVTPLLEPEWTPTSEERAALPPAIEWEILWYDASRELVSSDRKSARRSP